MLPLLFSFFTICIFCSVTAEPLQFKIQGKAAILMNADSGAILFEENARELLFPASTTKIATALYTLHLQKDQLDIPITATAESLASTTQQKKAQSNFTLPPYWLEPDGTTMGIKKGETFILRQLLEGMLIASANDAANVIAHNLGTTIPSFMTGINEYLKKIGCQNTTYRNPHGLHDIHHQTTAYDLALMAQEGLKNPIFCEIVAKTSYLRPKTDLHPEARIMQGNKLVRKGAFYYPKAIGMKTGYHAKASSTLVAAARSEGRTLIAVLLGYKRPTMFEEAVRLFETAFNQPKVQRIIFQAGPQAFQKELSNTDHPLRTYLAKPLYLEYYPAEEPNFKCLLQWLPLSPPIKKNQPVAELLLVSPSGSILKKAELLASNDVNFSWLYDWLHYFSFF